MRKRPARQFCRPAGPLDGLINISDDLRALDKLIVKPTPNGELSEDYVQIFPLCVIRLQNQSGLSCAVDYRDTGETDTNQFYTGDLISDRRGSLYSRCRRFQFFRWRVYFGDKAPRCVRY